MPAVAETMGTEAESEPSSPRSTPATSFWGRLKWALSGAPLPRDEEDAISADVTAGPTRPGMRNLSELTVEDVCVPKAEIIAVPSTITKADLVKTFQSSGLTRLPVYDETLDKPLGFLHLKDLALKYGFNGNTAKRLMLKQMLRPLLFVPPSMPIGVLLTKMQAERRHMALVIDEYGGTDGLVTIEDLIEQVIGEIEDEHDIEEVQHFFEEKPGSYIAVAKTPLVDFEAAIGRSLTDHDDIDPEDIDTLGGLVFMLAGHVPTRNEVVPHPSGVEFEVLDADPRRIKRMRAHVETRADA